MNLDKFLTRTANSIYDALIKIDNNNKGFLMVVDECNVLLGTITDGDIRRALIKGINLKDQVEDAYNRLAEKVTLGCEFSRIIELFKNPKIRFLPITDEKGKLVNVITKSNMHVLLLEDVQFNMYHEFLQLDDSKLEHEIYNRPWGVYKTTFINEHSQSKIIKVNPKGILSLQEHKLREEYWIVINGKGKAIVGESEKNIESGNFIFIPKGCKHRLENTSDTQSLMIAEVQLGDYFGEDDIVRYEDVYGRM